VIVNKKLIILFVCVIIFFGVVLISNSHQRVFLRNILSSLKVAPLAKASASVLNEQEKKNDAPQYPFAAGEQLQYGIYSALLKVGSAVITYQGREEFNGTSVDVVKLEAHAPGFHDIDIIYGDFATFTPRFVKREISLFGEKISITEDYNAASNSVTVTRKAKETTVETIKSDKRIGNIILLLYYFRINKERLAVGDALTFNLPTKQLLMKVSKFSQLSVPMGKFRSVYIHSLPPKFKVWLAPDEGNLPLKIQGAIGFGNTFLSLIDVKKSS